MHAKKTAQAIIVIMGKASTAVWLQYTWPMRGQKQQVYLPSKGWNRVTSSLTRTTNIQETGFAIFATRKSSRCNIQGDRWRLVNKLAIILLLSAPHAAEISSHWALTQGSATERESIHTPPLIRETSYNKSSSHLAEKATIKGLSPSLIGALSNGDAAKLQAVNCERVRNCSICCLFWTTVCYYAAIEPGSLHTGAQARIFYAHDDNIVSFVIH